MFPEGEFSSSQPKRKKDAATMVFTNMILIETLKNNMNFNILSRNRFQFNDFVLFQLHESLEWMLNLQLWFVFLAVV